MSVTKQEETLKTFNVFCDPFAKSLLRSDEMRPILAHILSKLTGFVKEDILRASFIGGELPKDNLKQKGQIADIIINLDEKRSIVVEINQKRDPALISKNGYYAMKVALSKRTKDVPDPEVWLVSIDKFLLEPIANVPQYFKVLDEHFGTVPEFPGYHSVHLPIDYIIKKGYNDDRKLYQFAKIFNATTLEEVKEICKGDDKFMRVYEKVESLTKDPMFLLYYNAEEEAEIVKESMKRYALEQGHKEGLEQGIEQGIGRGEEAERKKLIKKMNSKGMTPEEISTYTDLSLQQINSCLKA